MGIIVVIVLISASLSMILWPASSSVVKLSLVIPDELRVTDVNLRFENNRFSHPGSFEGEVGPEDGPVVVKGLPDRIGKVNTPSRDRQRNDYSHQVEMFSGVAKNPEERHNTINKVIKLPAEDFGPIRK